MTPRELQKFREMQRLRRENREMEIMLYGLLFLLTVVAVLIPY